MSYTIRKAGQAPALDGHWDSAVWASAQTMVIGNFHLKSSDHRPDTRARLLYDDQHLYVIFKVGDRYVRAVHKGYQQAVCTDSCVEFFVQPVAGKAYLNFELNCGGAILLNVNGPEGRNASGRFDSTPVSPEWLDTIRIFHSMPETVEPEIEAETTWIIEYAVPFSLLEHHVEGVRHQTGTEWRANLYKCGDKTSHPHWGSWMPIGERLDFHKPGQFGLLVFE